MLEKLFDVTGGSVVRTMCFLSKVRLDVGYGDKTDSGFLENKLQINFIRFS